MFLGNLHYKEQCEDLPEQIQECLRYAHEHLLAQYKPGSYPIRDKDLYVNVACYETTRPENRFWEAHRAYLDLHLILEGEERIDLNFIDNMECKPYVEQDDFVPAAGERKASVVLEAGDFLLCYPEDVHMTGLLADQPGDVKKAIFKIKL